MRAAPLELKAELGRAAWESALAGDALRERVFELRYPTRFLDEQAEELPLESADDLRSLLAELGDDYADYLDGVDELADGPSRRLAEAALRDKERQCEALAGLELSGDDPARDPRYFASPVYWPDVLDPATPTARASRSSSARRSAI